MTSAGSIQPRPIALLPSGVAPTPRYRPFGAFRLLLALVVVCSHAAWVVRGTFLGDMIIGANFGSAAVLGFFVLSGYILTEAALCFYASRPARFGKNRLLKIIPAFLGALVLSIVVHIVAASQGRLYEAIAFEGYSRVPADIWSASNILYNALSVFPLMSVDLYRQVTGGEADLYVFVRYIWAVRVEMAFYAVLFLLLTVPARIWQRVNWLASVGIWLAFLVFCVNEFLWPVGFDLQFGPYFLLGALIYLAGREPRRYWLALLACFLLVAVHQSRFITHVPLLSDAWFAAIAEPKRQRALLLFGIVLACVWLLPKLRLSRGAARWDRRLGDLSYALYLNHYALLVAYSALGHTPSRPVLTYMTLLAVSLVLALVMHTLVERPLVAIRDRVRGRGVLVSDDADQQALPSHATVAQR